MAKRGVLHALRDILRLQQLGSTDLRSNVQERLPLYMVQQAMDLYQNNMTAGKVLLVAARGKMYLNG